MQHKIKVSAQFSSYSAGKLRKDHIEREIKKSIKIRYKVKKTVSKKTQFQTLILSNLSKAWSIS